VDGATFINGDVDTVNITNMPNYGKLEIAKTTNRGYSVPETGAVFEVYSTAYASYAAAPTSLKDTLTTNVAGTAITKDLPYGVYQIHQIGIPAGTISAADTTVTIGATNGATVHRDLVNTVYWGQVEINKTTSYAGNVKLEVGLPSRSITQLMLPMRQRPRKRRHPLQPMQAVTQFQNSCHTEHIQCLRRVLRPALS